AGRGRGRCEGRTARGELQGAGAPLPGSPAPTGCVPCLPSSSFFPERRASGSPEASRRRGARMSEIDWNTELRRLEREFDGLPPEPTAEERAAHVAAVRAAQQRREQQALAVGVWARLLLVAALAGMLPLWPY